MQYTDYLPVGSPVVVRSYVSGVVVGRIVTGEAGTVVLRDWRWLRRWEGVGGAGSVYDLIRSDKAPTQAGPLTPGQSILQQADAVAISEQTYKRLAGE